MLPSPYSALLTAPIFPNCSYSEEAAEKKNPYHILTERHLQAMWLEQKYFKSLKVNNLPIEVLSPGIWNSEAGPDFLKAHIKIGNQEWRGDIELHLSQEGWYYHHHHTDPNYNQVILHLCYWQPKKERPILSSEGKIIASAYIQPSLTISEARILKLIDLDLYPYKHFAGSGNCSKTLFDQLSKEKTVALFRSAAAFRLKEKYARLEAKIPSPQDLLLGGISTVLGYKHNAEIFLEIFHHLNTQTTKNEKTILALALGVADFFNLYYQKKWGGSIYYQELHTEFKACDNNLKLPSYPLKLDKIRPANHPVRRLAILSKMILDPHLKQLEHTLFSLWTSYWQTTQKKDWKKLQHAFMEHIPPYHDKYWEHHYTFEVTPQPKPITLIGIDLKREILINVYLPLLYSNIETRNNEAERAAFINFYSSFPATKTKKSIYLDYRFFGDKKKGSITSNADLQQGAYQIHRDFCVHFEASCQGCPFVERYKKAFG